jgi:hypothetical protein
MAKTYRRSPGSDFAYANLQHYLPRARWTVYALIAERARDYPGNAMTAGEITTLMLAREDANRTNPSYHRRADELVQQGALREGELRNCTITGNLAKTYALVHDPEVIQPLEYPEAEPGASKSERAASRRLAKLNAAVEEVKDRLSGYGTAAVDAQAVVKMLTQALEA